MATCPHRQKLSSEYNDAVVMFSASVNCLRDCHGDSLHKFAEQRQETEIAQKYAQSVRVMLEVHTGKSSPDRLASE